MQRRYGFLGHVLLFIVIGSSGISSLVFFPQFGIIRSTAKDAASEQQPSVLSLFLRRFSPRAVLALR